MNGRYASFAAVVLLAVGVCSTGAAELNLVPQPKSVKLNDGDLTLTSASRIVATDPSLAPLAKVLSGEIYLATGLRLNTGDGAGAAGDIVIKHDDNLKDEAYGLDVNDRATVRGGTYVADAWGTVTLLQSLSLDGGKVDVPLMTVEDHPDLPYRGFMKDVARQYVPIEALHSAVELCRLYKVRYLHLHLSDDHAWVFPSTAYPLLGTRNEGAHSGEAPKVYKLDELKELVQFADERGVTIVPEIEGPGHSGAMRLPMADLFDSPTKPGGEAHLGVINMVSEEVYPALDTIVGEIADVFKSSPYIHIGCDEVSAGGIREAKTYTEFMKKHGLTQPIDAFDYYVQQMVGFVNEHGKTAIAWEGVPLEKLDPKKLIIMMWTDGNGPEAKRCVKEGFRIINAPNTGYGGLQDRIVKDDQSKVGLPEFNYEMNLYSFGAKGRDSIGDGNPLLIGAQINDWESAWDYSVFGARHSVPARDANAWNANEKRASYDDYNKRFEKTDALLERLMQPIAVTNKTQDDFDQRKAIQRLRAHTMFVKPVMVSMDCPLQGTTIRYTLDGTAPSAESKAYDSPVQVDKSTDLRVALFDANGTQLAPEQNLHYDHIDYEKTLTTGKPVTASSHEGENMPEYVNDGFVMKDIWRGWWAATPCPQWIKIDLEQPQAVNRVIVYPYWDGGRYYQYIVEVSTDDKNWTKVVDMSKNTTPATPKGHESKFDAIQARYIKVTVLKDSANKAAHLVEVRAYGPDSN